MRGPWSHIIAVLAALIIGGATATLGTLVYCVAFFNDIQTNRHFFRRVANYAGSGAILGTLLALRTAFPLSLQRRPITFNEFLGVIGNAATMLTLLMIAMCWFRLWLEVRGIARESADSSKSRYMSKFQRVPTFFFLWLPNLVGTYAAFGVWQMFKQ